VNPFAFLDEPFTANFAKTSPWAIRGYDCVILADVGLTLYQCVTDGQTEGQTVNPAAGVANTGLCIASYADAL